MPKQHVQQQLTNGLDLVLLYHSQKQPKDKTFESAPTTRMFLVFVCKQLFALLSGQLFIVNAFVMCKHQGATSRTIAIQCFQFGFVRIHKTCVMRVLLLIIYADDPHTLTSTALLNSQSSGFAIFIRIWLRLPQSLSYFNHPTGHR